MMRSATRCEECDAKYCVTCQTPIGRSVQDQCQNCIASNVSRVSDKEVEEARARAIRKAKERTFGILAIVAIVAVAIAVLVAILS